MMCFAFLLIFFPLIALHVSGMDPYENIRKELGLTHDSSETLPDHSGQEITHTTISAEKGKTGKWKAPPGFHTVAAREQRRVDRIKKDNPNFTDEEVKRVLSTLKPVWRPSPGYQTKDNYIERKKNQILKDDPTNSPDVAHAKAQKAYDIFRNARRESRLNHRAKLRKAKEYIKDVDSELAKSMRIDGSNSKESWIGRRVGQLKKNNPQLKHSEAYENAHKQYLIRLEKQNVARRKKRAELAQKLKS